MHSEVYPELASVLQRFVAGVQNALGSKFLGAYLVGSLATGDFDLDSDVDFLILTNAELSDAEVRSLQTTHVDIHALGCYPAEHLEGSHLHCYIGGRLTGNVEGSGAKLIAILLHQIFQATGIAGCCDEAIARCENGFRNIAAQTACAASNHHTLDIRILHSPSLIDF